MPDDLAEADEGAVRRPLGLEVMLPPPPRDSPKLSITAGSGSPPGFGMRHGAEPLMVSSGTSPDSKAAASTKVLNDEPAWRPMPVVAMSYW